MSLRLYDTAARAVRDFTPLRAGRASLYVCGLTVQGPPHVGHIRAAVSFDVLRRWLEASGLDVTYVRNVTDIDDKILAKAAERDIAWWAWAYLNERACTRAYDVLGVLPPTYEPRATGHIPEMVELMQRLIDRGHAYAVDGDVYFDVRSFPSYGSLTGQTLENLEPAADTDTDERKRDPRDFALWKATKPGEPATASWDTPWGRGRPGWHLECSAMAGKYLGEAFDIHGGGLDLRFPHHENELAQSAAAGREFANFWLHNGLVTYQGEKMSKSIGNTVSPQDMLREARPLAVRYYLGQAHYRSVLDYRPTSLQEATAAVERVESVLRSARAAGLGLDWDAQDVPEEFVAVMDDDLNVPRALAVLHETVRAANSALAAGEHRAAQPLVAAVAGMSDVLGLLQLMALDAAGDASGAEHRALDALVQDLLARRAAAREARDWALADTIRDQLAAAGVVVKDGAQGSAWSVES